jgi:hypothetical protein
MLGSWSNEKLHDARRKLEIGSARLARRKRRGGAVASKFFASSYNENCEQLNGSVEKLSKTETLPLNCHVHF